MELAINWYSVLGASLVGFVVGALWYGPLFGDPWMRSLGMDPEVVKKAPKKGMRQLFTIVFLLQWCMAFCLAAFFGPEITTVTGTLYGFLTGFAWVAFALTVNALFEQKRWSYIFINGSYWTVSFTVMGAILGTWHG
jgi:MFS family permease